MMDKNSHEFFSIIIPAYNEADRFQRVLNEALKVKEASEVIFVNDGSTDKTGEKIAEYHNSKLVYMHHKNNRGKGAALQTGVGKAKNEIILFLDADLKNITASKISKIAAPVLSDYVDLSRGSFRRKRGRVTEYAVKPMMKVLFPDVYFDQPISGQICAKKSFLKNVAFEGKYGVDIGILFDAIEQGQRIIEVDIGKLEHKANNDEDIAEMSRQVLETMIKKAGLIQHKYKLIVFTLDNTLIERHALKFIFDRMGCLNGYKLLKAKVDNQEISFTKFVLEVAKLFKGFSPEEIEKICIGVPLAKYSAEVINALKKRKYQVAIVSSNLSSIVIPISKLFGVETTDSIYLEKDSNGKYTGRITKPSTGRWLSVDLQESFKKSFLGILRKRGVRASETIMVANSSKAIPLIETAGLGIAYRPEDKDLKDKALKTMNVLPELLAIVE